MPATEAQVDSLKEDVRALSDTVSEILVKVDGLADTLNGVIVTVKDHGRRLDKVESRLDRMDERFDKIDERFDKMDVRMDRMDGAIQEILTLVRSGS